MASNCQQSLLETPKSSTFSCKILCFSISLSALLCSAALLVPKLSTISQPDLPIPPNLCSLANDPRACLTMISEVVPKDQSDGITLLQKSLIKYVQDICSVIEVANKIKVKINGQSEQVALADCLELMDLSIDRVTDSAAALATWTNLSQVNAQSWLSSVLTNHDTCLDGLHVLGKSFLGAPLKNLISKAKAYLAVLAAVSPSNNNVLRSLKGKFPSWVRPRDRKLLESPVKDIKADAVVAQDGSGNYQTVTEAVAAAPEKSKNRYVIYVKMGTYKENVEVGKKKKNLMIVGDGMDFTIITGSLNVVDGSTTFRSATLAAAGDGFILQDISVQNTAGPEKHQAVALRVNADQSVINRCRLDAFQDTLYTHSLRQFYRDCSVTGTVDFIFGNAAVVFQNSELIARKPMNNQKNMVTAQGRTDPNQNTGISIQQCNIIASPDLEQAIGSIKTYLGRPWKLYSRTVIMQSHIGGHIDPVGWAEWDGQFALETLYYGEYMNGGEGAGTGARVKWPGFHVITEAAEAMKFTVAELLQGGEWLKSTGVAFTEGL